MSTEILNLEISLGHGQDFEEKMINLKAKLDVNKKLEIINCPFCDSELKKINKKVERLKEAEELLNDNLKFIATERESYFKEERNNLMQEKEILLKERKNIISERRNLKKRNKLIEKREDLIELIIEKKVRIIDTIKNISGEEVNNLQKDIALINDELEIVQRKIDGYNINKQKQDIEGIIQTFMNKVVEKLDFEKYYSPVNLKFDINTFNLYQQMSNQTISISSMGSGSNWLSCHIGLFLGLQYYFCKRGNKCSIPSFLFIDQPSQVYFPEKQNKSTQDYEKVENIYNTLNWAINKIQEETEIELQIIVTDHADELSLVESSFEEKVTARWKEENIGFISKENIVKS